jgi:hypothetical protein
MGSKKTSEETERQKEAFIRHLNDASEVVSSWEPWERGILGNAQNGSSSGTKGAALECANSKNGDADSHQARDSNHNGS